MVAYERFDAMWRLFASLTCGVTMSGSAAMLYAGLAVVDMKTDGSNIWIPLSVVVVIFGGISWAVWQVAMWVRDIKDEIRVGNSDAAAAKTLAQSTHTSLGDLKEQLGRIESGCHYCKYHETNQKRH